MDELKTLVKLVSDSVDRIEKSCKARNVAFPSLSGTYSLQSEAARLDPAVLQAAADISAATAQLSALVRPPPLTLITTSRQHFVSAALGFANEANVAEILRSSGPKGLHVNEIAERAKVNANKLGRCLRLLATEHIFLEVSPNVFANNRISSVLDSGKDIADLLDKPEEKYDGTDGISALLKHNTEHGLKSSAYLAETLKDPETTHSFAVTKTAFNKAYRTDLPQWTWFELPEQKADLRAFGIAMRGSANLQLHDALLDCLEWSNLPAGSKFVDVGGGVGTQTMILARAHPHLKYVVQDRAETLAQAKQVWKEKFPDATDKELVTFQPINFLKDQPVKDASVFFMRSILHDWPDAECIQILKTLRAAASPRTQLLIKGIVVQYASNGDAPLTHVPGNDVPTPPAPLLPNGGHANAFDYLIDMHMMLLMNGQERTLEHLNELLEQSGWQLSRIFREPYYYTGGLQHVVAVPA